MSKFREFIDPEQRPQMWFALGLAGLLLLALLPLPYGYYRFLRWVVCIGSILTACLGWMWKRHWALGPFPLLAVLFNPLFPVHLNRETWAIFDVAGAVFFVLAALLLRVPKDAAS